MYYYILAVIPPHQPSPKTHYPSLCTMYLPPLSKGGGLTARHKLLLCCFLLAICPLFLYCKLFFRQDGGIALHHQPSPKTHYPSKTTNTLASPRKRGGGTADIIFRLAVQYSDSPAFAIQKQFRAVTVGIVIAQKLFSLIALVFPLVHSSNVIKQNSEPEKCYPTNSTVGSLLS